MNFEGLRRLTEQRPKLRYCGVSSRAKPVEDICMSEGRKDAMLIYGIITLIIFGSLIVGFAVQTPLVSGAHTT
jgi:hypothetical protein